MLGLQNMQQEMNCKMNKLKDCSMDRGSWCYNIYSDDDDDDIVEVKFSLLQSRNYPRM